MPVGRTCFFRLEIPPYKSEDAFRDKLLYAIRYCHAIDADIVGRPGDAPDEMERENRERRDSRRSSQRSGSHRDEDEGDNNNEDDEE